LDMRDAEERYGLEPVDALTPEKVFAARWAMALLGEAMTRLGQEYATSHKMATFEALKAFLDVGNSKDPPSYEQAAAVLHISVGAVKTLIHRLRKQYTALVREEIGRTVSNPADVDAEIHDLCEALMAAEGWIESFSKDTVNAILGQSAQRFEHYELVKGEDGTPIELGRGAMGITYKAFDVDLHCPVTLKVISERYLGNESARLRFLREARAAASVRHPNVASVFHLGRSGDNYFYAMEFVEGETLEKLIKRSGRVKVKVALEIATQVAAGLTAVHKQKLVHRDIKPSNIMVSVEEGSTVTAKIIDLGLAKPAPDAPADAAISTPGAFAGTPEFASPEQFAGIGVDIRSDLYSLGVVLWEMLTDHVVFRGSPAVSASARAVASRPARSCPAARRCSPGGLAGERPRAAFSGSGRTSEGDGYHKGRYRCTA
jgi:hypothetical protein